MAFTRRALLRMCIASTGTRLWAQSGAEIADELAAFPGTTDPVGVWHQRLSEAAARHAWMPTAAWGVPRTDAVPWAELGQLLRSRYRDLRRHFVFEYYPWYDGDSFWHWDQWGRRPPADIAANSMPLLGAYDSRSAAVIEQHAQWMAEAGVGTINLSWWGIGSFSDRAVSIVMDVMHAHDIHVAFHLEPYGPDRVDRLAADVSYLLTKYGERRRWDCFFFHERADGSQGPVFKVFRTTLPQQIEDCHGVMRRVPDYVPPSTWLRATDHVRAAVDGTFDHLTLLSDTWDAACVRAAGFDGIAIYDPVIEREEWLGHALAATRLGMPFSFSVNPGLDEIGRRGLPADSCDRPRPFLPHMPGLSWSTAAGREQARRLSEQRIAETLEWTLLLQTHPWLGNVDQGFFLVYVTSFNEWHEGTQFEPMKAEAELIPEERIYGYRNPSDGVYRLRRLANLLRRLLA